MAFLASRFDNPPMRSFLRLGMVRSCVKTLKTVSEFQRVRDALEKRDLERVRLEGEDDSKRQFAGLGNRYQAVALGHC